jgi:hypothetical protein
MSHLRATAVTAFLAIAAFPAAAGALQAPGIARVGLAECAGVAPKMAAGLPEQTASSPEAMQKVDDVAPDSEAWLRDYLDLHALTQEDNGARMALMPWPALRTHAN